MIADPRELRNSVKKIGIITLTRQNSLAYETLRRIVMNLGYEPICGQAIGSDALFLSMEEIHLVGYDFLGPFFQRAGFSDVDCILISAPYTANLFGLPKVIRSLRAVSSAPVVIGGNEVSNNYRNLMVYRFIPFVHHVVDVGPDFIVRGAAEWVLPSLLPLVDKETLVSPWTSAFLKKLLDIPNLVFWVPTRRALIATRLAAYDLSEKEIFSLVKYGKKSAAVTFQRACVWAKKSRGGCLFCAIAAQFGESFHCAVQTGWFVKELVDFLEKNKQIKNIDIWDDTFNIEDEWSGRICECLQEAHHRVKREIAFTCFLRPGGVTPGLINQLKAANVKAAFIGADAVTEDLSKRLRRGSTVSELDRSLKMLSHAGILCNLSVQLFSPESTIVDVEKTAELAIQYIKDDRSAVHVHLYTFPLFGSAVYRLLKARKNLKSIPGPLMKSVWGSGFEALPISYDYRHYDPEVEIIKQKTCRLLGVEVSFVVRTYPGNSIDPKRLKEVLIQVKNWCLEAKRFHPVKSMWYLILLSLEEREKGLTGKQMIDLLSRNEPASEIPEALRKSHGDFGFRFTLSRSFETVIEILLREGWIHKADNANYLLTPSGKSYLFSAIQEQGSNPIIVGGYGTIGRNVFLRMQEDKRPHKIKSSLKVAT